MTIFELIVFGVIYSVGMPFLMVPLFNRISDKIEERKRKRIE